MANTQTTVPIFVAAQVLEAEQLNNSAATGVPVFATTVTRDAGFGGAGEKALAEGQLCYLEATNVVQYYDGAAWATLGPAPAVSSGLTFIAGQTVNAAASIAITNLFSATYTSYLFITSQLDKTVDNDNFFLTFGNSGTPDTSSNYSIKRSFSSGSNNQANFNIGGNMGTTDNYLVATFTNPNVAARTFMSYTLLNNFSGGVELNMGAGLIDTNTQYTDIFFTPGSGNIGPIKYQLFGYANS